MKVVTAIDENYSIMTNNSKKIFLAGGITDCPDWQQLAIDEFSKMNSWEFTLYNPRRKNFPIGDLNASEQQITWEYNHLRDADVIIFWFAQGSLNPIVLYELGMWGNSRDKQIFIGCDPEYKRYQDVKIQTQLARPGTPIYSSLVTLCGEAINYVCH